MIAFEDLELGRREKALIFPGASSNQAGRMSNLLMSDALYKYTLCPIRHKVPKLCITLPVKGGTVIYFRGLVLHSEYF